MTSAFGTTGPQVSLAPMDVDLELVDFRKAAPRQRVSVAENSGSTGESTSIQR